MSKFGIEFVTGELKGKEIVIQPNQIIRMGRDPQWANVVLQDLSVSRMHCTIQLVDGTYQIMDISSGGIKKLDGTRLEHNMPSAIKSGEYLRIGTSGTMIKFQ